MILKKCNILFLVEKIIYKAIIIEIAQAIPKVFLLVNTPLVSFNTISPITVLVLLK